ncbi:MAG TPA: SCO family protein, partial [Candidatus Baltobacteraceae bacterium]|nr:SCO family protein [Candidatus Baltobacteraceae bacterium]
WIPAMNVVLLGLLLLCGAQQAGILFAQDTSASVRTFAAHGVILEIRSAQVVIRHEAIPGYMDAMTMPFPVKSAEALNGLVRGDVVNFQLHVTDAESWADHFQKTGNVSPGENNAPGKSAPEPVSAAPSEKSLLDYKFTNELGQAVSFNDFRGQALAITFFYTRCPLPEFCPRLSKNFQEASEKLERMTNAPANWHFISVSFDPEFDTPEMLRSYGEGYHYDAARWSFFTGPPEKIAELAHGVGVEYRTDDGTINHNFRTLIVNASGHLQMVFPTSGDLSDQIVSEIIKAAAVGKKH